MRDVGEDWVVVYPDGWVSRPLTKRAAKARSTLSHGSRVVPLEDAPDDAPRRVTERLNPP